MDPQVREVMEPFLNERFGNPSSLHKWGRGARLALDEARETVAAAMGADPAEICFTSSGTEASNLAIIGTALESLFPTPPSPLPLQKSHLLVSAVEHHCVLQAAEFLQPFGFEVEIIPVDRMGKVDPDRVRALIREETLLVSVMHANNEIGTLQPVQEIARVCRERGVLFHTDSVQTFGTLPVNVDIIGCDLLSVSAHKLYGPQGVGALYARAGVNLKPLIVGGGQERERRAGTENVAGIVGFAKAVQIAEQACEQEAMRLTRLRDETIRSILDTIPDSRLNGHPVDRVPNNLHFRFDDVPADSLLIALDRAGIAASSGAACSAGSLEPSHVLMALGLSEAEAQTGIRMTLGRGTTQAQLDYVRAILQEEVQRIRSTHLPARPTVADLATSQRSRLR
jgi:cysteine desulfurase